MSNEQISQKIKDFIDAETNRLSTSDYKEILEEIHSECQFRLDALDEDEKFEEMQDENIY